ncbi:MAG TPA: sugar transferase, partial [Chthoniobacteraceae bacterium]|nr:sugar transferase [Chthoniobacteraceae bacterium]
LRHFTPRLDATFILDADPEVIHARKPEVPVAELKRQREAYRALAAGSSRMHLIKADASAVEVGRVISRDVILLLARRQRRWGLPAVKRSFDLILSTAALVFLAPLLALIAVLVGLKLGTPVVFRQQRPGLHGAPFTIYKFRTMTGARDATGRLLPDAERLTRFGKFLRSTSLDELPELINVLRGEMSLVGPRPLLMEYLPLYSPEQKRRHDLLPGITGWAQINGRNAASWPRKFALDVWYVDHQSLWLDVKILAMTVWKVLRRDGINQPGRATADRFVGETEVECSVAKERLNS